MTTKEPAVGPDEAVHDKPTSWTETRPETVENMRPAEDIMAAVEAADPRQPGEYTTGQPLPPVVPPTDN